VARPITFRIWLDGKLVAEPTIEEPTIKIGSGGTSHVRLQHPSVSRVHCVIEVGAELEIMDLGSSAGTFVNSAPVTRAPIASGDQLRIGDYLLDVLAAEATNLLGSPVRARVTPAPEPVVPPNDSLRPPALLDLSAAGDAGLPAPPAASVVLPRVAAEPERGRPGTVELQEADLLEPGHDTDPPSRRRNG
jgi:pSer/pThr/pTyr-binding forkhead associated (FHA) protein